MTGLRNSNLNNSASENLAMFIPNSTSPDLKAEADINKTIFDLLSFLSEKNIKAFSVQNVLTVIKKHVFSDHEICISNTIENHVMKFPQLEEVEEISKQQNKSLALKQLLNCMDVCLQVYLKKFCEKELIIPQKLIFNERIDTFINKLNKHPIRFILKNKILQQFVSAENAKYLKYINNILGAYIFEAYLILKKPELNSNHVTQQNLFKNRLESLIPLGANLDVGIKVVYGIDAPNSLKFHERTLLHSAIYHRSLEDVKLIVSNGADINLEYPIKKAIDRQQKQIIEFLLTLPNIELNFLYGGYNPILNELIKEILTNPKQKDFYKEILILFINHPNIDINFRSGTAMRAALKNLELFKLLLDTKKVDLTIKDENGLTLENEIRKLKETGNSAMYEEMLSLITSYSKVISDPLMIKLT